MSRSKNSITEEKNSKHIFKKNQILLVHNPVNLYFILQYAG